MPCRAAIPGGVGDVDPDTFIIVRRSSMRPGGDGALTFSLRDTGAPPGFTYVLAPNGDLLIQQGGVTVMTVTIDPATGALHDHAEQADRSSGRQ